MDFVDNYGEPTTPNAILTQLSHKTVLRPDAVGGEVPARPEGEPARRPCAATGAPRQQVALSHVQAGEENNGLFRLNLDDDRYLPFEGTGAVSTWRLQLTGRRSVDDPGHAGRRLAHRPVHRRGRRPGVHQRGEGHAQAVLGRSATSTSRREFPDEWAEFLGGDGDELVLPVSADMFPNMAGRQITSIYTRFELAAPGAVSMVLNGEPDWTLEDGKVLSVNRLGVRPGRTGAWRARATRAC